MIEKFDAKTKEGLTLFLVESIGEKAYDGITYVLLSSSNEEDRKKISNYNNIRKHLESNGYDSNQVMQALQVPNGVIFDLNVEAAREMTVQLARMIGEATDGKIGGNVDLINDGPMKRREKDINELAKYLVAQAKQGKNHVELALFSRNFTRKIICTAKDSNNKDVQIKLNAYAVRHWDIPKVSNVLMSMGYKITGAKAGEILPSKTGVRFTISVAKA